MPQDLKEILNTIEILRQKLHSSGAGKVLTDPEVVAASQKLNEVLNEYYRLLKQKEETK